MVASQRLPARVLALGDGAVIAELADTVDLVANAAAHRIAARIRIDAPTWVIDVVPAIVTVTIHFAANTAAEAAERRAGVIRLLQDAIDAVRADEAPAPGRSVDIPVCYEPAFALDLDEVAQRTGLNAAEVIALHQAGEHRVLMIGFVPGHPYIGGLDPRLSVPRRATPRPRLERGSVAIANAQTSIYPLVTPGGWNVIGRTPLVLFDATREPPTLLQPGDAVRFVAIGRDEFERMQRGNPTIA